MVNSESFLTASQQRLRCRVSARCVCVVCALQAAVVRRDARLKLRTVLMAHQEGQHQAVT
jgi:hypothetical protein